MGFLRTIDLSEVKNGEFGLDFKAFGENRGVDGLKLKINKIELLEVTGHWFMVLRHSTCPRVFFLALGRMTYSHFPNQFFIWH